MKVNLTRADNIIPAIETRPGEVYFLTCFLNPCYAIRLDESDEAGRLLFAEFDGTVCHVNPPESVKKVLFAEVTIKD